MNPYILLDHLVIMRGSSEGVSEGKHSVDLEIRSPEELMNLQAPFNRFQAEGVTIDKIVTKKQSGDDRRGRVECQPGDAVSDGCGCGGCCDGNDVHGKPVVPSSQVLPQELLASSLAMHTTRET